MSEERKEWQRLLSWTILSVAAMELQPSQGSRVNRGCQLPSSDPLPFCQSHGSPRFSWPMIEPCEDNTKSTHSYPVQYSSNGQFMLRDSPLSSMRSSQNYTEFWSSPHPTFLSSSSPSQASDLGLAGYLSSPSSDPSLFNLHLSISLPPPTNSALLQARPAEWSSHST